MQDTGSATLDAILGIRMQKRELYDLPGELTPANNFNTAALMMDLYLSARPGGKEANLDDIDIPVLMTILKITRIAVAKDHFDNYPDGANYLILAGDRIARRNFKGTKPSEIHAILSQNRDAQGAAIRSTDEVKIPGLFDKPVEEMRADRTKALDIERERVKIVNIMRRLLDGGAKGVPINMLYIEATEAQRADWNMLVDHLQRVSKFREEDVKKFIACRDPGTAQDVAVIKVSADLNDGTQVVVA